MAVYRGWAFTKGVKPTREEISKRYEEIKDTPGVVLKKNPAYAHCKFSGELETDEAKALSSMDLLIIADQGNLCFGGDCSKTGNSFRGRYNTD